MSRFAPLFAQKLLKKRPPGLRATEDGLKRPDSAYGPSASTKGIKGPLCWWLCAILAMGLGAQHVPAQDFAWAGSMGATNANDYGAAIAVDKDGNVYTTGVFGGSVDFDIGPGVFVLSATALRDVFVTKVNRFGEFLWARAWTGGGIYSSPSIAVDDAGNVYTTGSFFGTNDFDPGPGISTLTAAGSRDIFVSKLDSAGDLVWARAMGGALEERGFGIKVDKAGNVYTTGEFMGLADFDPGAGTFTFISAGETDVFVSKLDSAGDFAWAKAMGGSSLDRSVGIDLDGAGNVYTTGYFSVSGDFDPGAGVSVLSCPFGSRKIFVSKLNSAGDFVWAKAMGSGVGFTQYDFPRAIAVDAAGNVHTTGFLKYHGDFDPGPGVFTLASQLANGGPTDIWISKLDSAGDFVWARLIGGSTDDVGTGIAVDSLSNVYITGYYGISVDFDPGPGTSILTTPLISQNAFVSKFDSAGDFVWAGALSGSALCVSYGIAVDAAGGVLTTGYFTDTIDFDPGPGTYPLTPNGSTGIWVSKLSPSTLPPVVTTITIDSDPMTGVVTCAQDPAIVSVNGYVRFRVGAESAAATIAVPGLLSPTVVTPGLTSTPVIASTGGIFPYTVTMAPPGFPLTTSTCELQVIQTVLAQNGAPAERVTVSSLTPTELDVSAPSGSTYIGALSDQLQLPGLQVPPFIPLLELDLSSSLFGLTYPVNTLAPFVQGLQGGIAGQDRISFQAPFIPPGTPTVTTYLQVLSLSTAGLSGLSQRLQVDWGP